MNNELIIKMMKLNTSALNFLQHSDYNPFSFVLDIKLIIFYEYDI